MTTIATPAEATDTPLPAATDAEAPPTRILMVHPGASWSTADVHHGLRFGLNLAGAVTANYQLDVRIARSHRWLQWNWRQSGKDQTSKPTGRDAQYHAGVGVVERALRLDPDWVLVVSGMYVDVEVFKLLRKVSGVKVALLLTESPYDDAAQAALLPYVDLAWTHERTSVATLQAACPSTPVRYLQHGWHPAVHIPTPVAPDVPAHDVVFVGTGFPERCRLLQGVDWTGVDLGLYGVWNFLGSRSKLRPYVRGMVTENAYAAQLYQAAKVNLNINRRMRGFIINKESSEVEGAESLNPRIWELAATGSFFLTDHRPELDDVFGPGVVPTFSTPKELQALLREYLGQPFLRRQIAERCRRAVQGHSWHNRALQVLADMEAVCPTSRPA